MQQIVDRVKKIALSSVLTGSLSLGLAACGTSAPSVSSQSHAPYVLGMVEAQTGPYAFLGMPEVNSADLAVKQINAAGGVHGHPLKLVVLDEKSSPTTAVEDFRQLIQTEHPLAVLGPEDTGGTMSSISEIQSSHISMISDASDAEVVQPASQRQWVFKMPPVDTIPMQTILNYLKAHHLYRVAFVYVNLSYGTGALADFQKIAPLQGFKLVTSESVDITSTNDVSQLAALKAASPAPQAIVVWDIPPSADIVAQAYTSLGLHIPIFYSDGVATNAFLTIGKSAVNGAYVAATKIFIANQLPNSDPQKSILQKYISSYNKEYGSSPSGPANMFGGFGYDDVYLAKDAILAAGKNPTPTSVRNALEHLTFTGVTGILHLSPTNHNGLTGSQEVLMQVVNGQWKWVKGYNGTP